MKPHTLSLGLVLLAAPLLAWSQCNELNQLGLHADSLFNDIKGAETDEDIYETTFLLPGADAENCYVTQFEEGGEIESAYYQCSWYKSSQDRARQELADLIALVQRCAGRAPAWTSKNNRQQVYKARFDMPSAHRKAQLYIQRSPPDGKTVELQWKVSK